MHGSLYVASLTLRHSVASLRLTLTHSVDGSHLDTQTLVGCPLCPLLVQPFGINGFRVKQERVCLSYLIRVGYKGGCA